MLTAIRAEISKLNRSLALLLCFAAPTMVAILAAVMLSEHKKSATWQIYSMSVSGLWSFFMLPMTVTALTVLMAQLEHGPRMWNHLLALPVARWRIYAAKAIVVVGLVAAMSLLLLVLMPITGWTAEYLAAGEQFKPGAYSFAETGKLLGTMFAASVLLIVLQLWAALRFRSFVPPLVLGIGGTFVAVAATGAEKGKYFPWLLPTNALASNPADTQFALALGLYGGLALAALMLIDLSRKELV